MRHLNRVRTLLLAVLAGAAASCSDSSAPTDDTTKPPADLSIIHVAATSTPLFNPSVSFYAVKGENSEGRIYFQDATGQQGEEYLRLRVDAPSLTALPDGRPIAEGDSVLITVTVVDPTEMLFQMEPTGLEFSPADPALLKIHYDHADGDLNDDGKVDASDDSIETTMAIWRQETPSDPFVRLNSILTFETDEADANITGFSRYALAY